MENLPELLRRLGRYQALIEAELAKGAKADHTVIEGAYAEGREFATAAAPYCHPTHETINRGKSGCKAQ